MPYQWTQSYPDTTHDSESSSQENLLRPVVCFFGFGNVTICDWEHLLIQQCDEKTKLRKPLVAGWCTERFPAIRSNYVNVMSVQVKSRGRTVRLADWQTQTGNSDNNMSIVNDMTLRYVNSSIEDGVDVVSVLEFHVNHELHYFEMNWFIPRTKLKQPSHM